MNLDLDNVEDTEFRINEKFAAHYSMYREKEEFQKLKELYGNEVDDSSDSEEDEGKVWSKSMEKQWCKVMSALKGKDSKIYDEAFSLSTYEEGSEEEETDTNPKKKKKKKKPMYVTDYNRKLILKNNGELLDSDSDDVSKARSSGYYDEQAKIKEKFKEVCNLDDSSDDGEDSALLKPRVKSKEEKDNEENNYLQWLKGREVNLDEETKNGLSALKSHWENPEIDENEKFLRDFILNQGHITKEDDEHIPSYSEILQLERDEVEVQKLESFEVKYNQRFQEPDEVFIARYPRTIDNSMRKPDTKRIEKREEIKQRKKREFEERKQELDTLKNMQRKEVEKKLLKLKNVSGSDVDFNDMKEILNSDFDPDDHDQIMEKLFDEKYYESAQTEDAKPSLCFEDDDKIEDWDNWQNSRCKEEEEEDSGGGEEDNCSIKLNGKSKFFRVMMKKKPKFPELQSEGKSFDEYLDEYYKFDYEDIIGGQPCRFKYRKVLPNNFGVSVGEVLSASDKELNAWASLKKINQYRTKEEEENDVKIYEGRERNIEKKLRAFPSLAASDSNLRHETKHQPLKNDLSKHRKKKRKNKLKFVKNKEMDAGLHVQDERSDNQVVSNNSVGKKKRKNKVTEDKNQTDGVKLKFSSDLCSEETVGEVISRKRKKGAVKYSSAKKKPYIDDERLKAYGFNPKRIRHHPNLKKSDIKES